MAGPGARITVPAPPRVGPITSLLTAADEFTLPPAAAGESDDYQERWLNGIQYLREPCGETATLPVGCPVDDLSGLGEPYASYPASTPGGTIYKALAAPAATIIRTDPVLIYSREECSSFGFPVNDYIGRARRSLQACEPAAVEYEFWTGTGAQLGRDLGVALGAGDNWYPEDQWLASAGATILNSGDSVCPSVALSLILDYLASCGCGGRGMVHAPVSLLPILEGHHLASRAAGRYEVPGGHVLVPGAGYPGTSPEGADPPDGTTWVYTTGMVRYARSDVEVTPGSFSEALDIEANTVTYRAERYYLVDWDRCCHAAVLVQFCDECICGESVSGVGS